jgi:hypothetical protein
MSATRAVCSLPRLAATAVQHAPAKLKTFVSAPYAIARGLHYLHPPRCEPEIDFGALPGPGRHT